MAGTAIDVVRNAVWKVLNDDSTITTTLSATVHQSGPDNEASPYIVLGPDTENSWNSYAKTRRDVGLTLDIWADDHDAVTAEAILDRCDILLDFKSNLTVVGYSVIAIHHDGVTTIREEDWKHIVARYRVLVEES